MSKEMETFAARLASFDIVLHPEKRRSSSAKSAKPITWPHSRPSPAELAHAGFYYNPYETNPDNTTCFLCQRALDGWEEDDNPITEHLKHSGDCGWAIMMDIQQRTSNPAEIEDPTSEKIAQARQATFGSLWPHDGKRGWVCQSDKMVEGGWYFCPNEESNDLASCAYCKLSLDGWEPKDDPFDEHYRRSSDCSFFVFAQPSGKKTKAIKKKSRTSKASRLSTQSVATTTSEAPTLDFDGAMDEEIIPEPSTKTKTTKKSTKSKSKSSKSKKAEAPEKVAQADGPMDVDGVDYTEPEPSKPKKATRGKKRVSDEMNGDGRDTVAQEGADQLEPPPKRRDTRSRNSVAQQDNYDFDDKSRAGSQGQDEIMQEEPKKSRKKTKKDSTSKSRKVSETSASKSSSKSRIPRDSELDAALEADLEVGTADPAVEGADDKPKQSKSKTKTSKKALEAPVQTTEDMTEDLRQAEGDQTNLVDVDAPPPKTKPSKTTKRKTTKKSKVEEDASDPSPETRVSPEVEAPAGVEASPERHDSFVSVEIVTKEPAQQSDVQAIAESATKKSSKKKSSSEKGKKASKTNETVKEPAEFQELVTVDGFEYRRSFKKPEPAETDDAEAGKDAENKMETPERQARRLSSKAPPKTAERYSDIPEEKQLARSIAKSRVSNSSITREDAHGSVARESPVMSPLPPASRDTPSLSPQSSDAENHPPSTKPSASRVPALTPSREKALRIPLAASTPSPSKRNANTAHLKSSHPWVPVDIEQILFAGNSDKENVDLNSVLGSMKGELTSPEKKMTVEEWIFWNAKNGEEKLKRECERLVSQFEKEGGRAMRVLEGIECID